MIHLGPSPNCYNLHSCSVPSIPAPTFADLQVLQPSKLQPPADQLSRRQLQVLEVGSWKQGLLTTLRVNHLNFEALQHKSLDIVNAMDLVSTTKALLFTLREEGFDHLLVHVQSVCRQNDIDIPDMNASYKRATGRSCQQKDSMTVCQHYHFDVFNSAIDFQHEELNSKFSDGAVELLILSSALEPKDNFKSFKVDDICKLAEKFYPEDFSEQEMHYLRCQLNHYKIDVLHHKSFQNMSTMTELCRGLVETKRAFSAMKHVKTALRNKMEEEFLADSTMIYIERELVEDIDSDSIIDEFYSTKHRRLQLK
ncbi:uncharacterized protein LOC119996606 isoform X2 [Tripterygium wilfordii]|uniref:uncharacterized protein LOC119996606 isoform X2 n=1 Tax=Tripterygium wilfordii TaxID=458696 RepID=UPI0018F82E41|nr:uncharacterized protein LOC119996606 isoform X2 [Tripterygium wilfordii]